MGMKIKKGVSRPGQWGWELELAGRAAFVPAILLGRAVPQARVAGGQRLMPCSGRAKTASHGPGLGLHGQLYQYPYIQIHNFRASRRRHTSVGRIPFPRVAGFRCRSTKPRLAKRARKDLGNADQPTCKHSIEGSRG